MEITSTVTTKTARHVTDEAAFSIDYTTTNGKLDRIQLNIFAPTAQPEDENSNETYLGSIYYDGQNLTCSIPWSDRVPEYFEAATDFISEIICSVEKKADEKSTSKK